MFSYGLNNVVDFTNFKGIIGIIAANHLGKSAILDIIIYALFDKFTRKGSTKDIINIRSDFFNVKLDIAIGQWTYTIIKSGARGKTASITSKTEFYRTHDIEQIVEHLEEDNSSKTKERILELFGCYEDIIHTSFSIQHDNSCFIDAENTERRKELQRIMRFDIIDKLTEMANHSLNKYKDIREHISKKIDNDFIVNTKKAKNNAVRLLEIHTENKAYAKEKIKTLHETILATSSKINVECQNFLDNNDYDYEETQDIIDDLKSQITNIDKNSNQYYQTIKQTIKNIELENLTLPETNGDSSNYNANILLLLKDALQDKENKENEIIRDANKKIRIIDSSNEKLFRSRKASNIKIQSSSTDNTDNTNNTNNTNITPSNYLLKLKKKHDDELTIYNDKIKVLENQIQDLKENEKTIKDNDDKILELEKQLVKLPDSLMEIVDNNIVELENEYKCSLENFVDSVKVPSNLQSKTPSIKAQSKTIIDNILSSSTYKEFEGTAKKFFISQEILKYKSDSNEDEIISKQEECENMNNELRIKMKTIKLLEQQIKQFETKISGINIQLQYIDNDISNLDNNSKIDGEISLNKQKRAKYESRIESCESKVKDIKENCKLIYKYEQIQTEKQSIDIKLNKYLDILIQFDKYKTYIDDNKVIQEKLYKLKEELSEFEEVIEEVEKQYNIENINVTKNNALLDQLRKDIADNKAIENNLKIFDVYRKALKQLPYQLLSKIQPVLEKKVNDLLSIITDFTLKFDMSDSKIDIYIDRTIYNMTNQKFNNGKTITKNERHILVNNASGFERFVSSLAIRIALLDMSNLPKINFMAIDEGWSCFDNTNLNNVGQILDYLKTKFDFILTISHLTEIKQHCDTTITLRKDEKGFSKIIV